MKSAALPDTIRKIDKQVFHRCEQLETVKFPGALEEIGDNAFEDCAALQAAVFCEGLVRIGHYAFKGCSALSVLHLPETLIHIGIDAFFGDKLEGTVCIPAKTETIREGAFAANPYIEAFEVSTDNQTYASVDGVLMSADGKQLICFPPARGGEYTVPASVECIDSAFACGTARLKVTVRTSNDLWGGLSTGVDEWK